MKKYCIAILMVCAIALFMPIIRNCIQYRMTPLEAQLIPFCDNTVWATGFSERAFTSIAIGADTNMVIKSLGYPLTRESYDDNLLLWRTGTNTEVNSNRVGPEHLRNWWHYTTGRDGNSWSGSSDSTHIRALVIDTNGLVVEKVYEFNFD